MATTMANEEQEQLKPVDEFDCKPPPSSPAGYNGNVEEEPNIYGDRQNLLLLSFLYLLQGIPLGLTACIPMMLQKRGASYSTQAKFSIAWWPFNLKLLWAPIVDSCYSNRFGRRKSWLVPVQYLIGSFMLVMSFQINQWLGDNETEANIAFLTVIFFMMTFLAATQDIVVDGWCLNLLKRRNVGYASICQNVGQPLGFFFGYALLVSLESPEFCNTWLRSEPMDEGLLTLAGFLWFWGICFLASTTAIALLKRENNEEVKEKQPLGDQHPYENLSVIHTYKVALQILNIPSIKTFIAVLLTVRIIWADYDGVAYLKFLNSGISNEKMIPMSALSGVPVQLLVSCLVAKYAAGSSPTKTWIYGIPFRTLLALSGTAIVWATPKLIPEDGVAPNYIYLVYLINHILYTFASSAMHIVLTAFFIKISDPSVGGTYMTLLNTVNNIGWTWPHTVALWMVESLTWRDCGLTVLHGNESTVNGIHNVTETVSVAALQKKCPIVLDGYFVETAVCFVFGLCWYKWGISSVRRLQRLPVTAWRVRRTTKEQIHLQSNP